MRPVPMSDGPPGLTRGFIETYDSNTISNSPQSLLGGLVRPVTMSL